MAITKNSQIDLNGNEMILDADADTSITADTDDQIDIKVGGTDTVVITGGAIALKGATPTLTIGDAGAEDTKIVFDGNAQDYYIGLDDSADNLIIGKGSTVGTTPAITIDSSQRVLIGATTDSYNAEADNLIIYDSGNAGLTIATGSTSGNNTIHFADGTSGDAQYRGVLEYEHNDDSMRFKVAGEQEAMRILSSQHLLVGTTSEYSGTSGNITANRQIDIGANDTNLKTLFFHRNAAEGEIGGLAAGITGFSTMGRINFVAEGVAGGSQSSSIRFKTTLNATEREVFRIDQQGQLFAFHLTGSTAGNPALKINTSSGYIYYDSSSLRYKDNVQDFPSSLSKVNQLRTVTYDDKATGEAGIGLIAEEVNEIAPELVTYKEIDGSLEPETVVYDRLTIHLLKGMQEQQTIIEALKARIETLEGS